MLAKLLKYDLKAGARMIPVAYLAIAASYLLGLLAKSLKIDQLLGTASVLLILGAIASVLVTFIFIILRFHKGVFGAEGYLTQTLPVGKGQIIASKAISAYIWTVLSILVAILAVLGLFQLLDMKDIGKYIELLFGSSFTPFVVFVTVTGFIQILAYIGELYFAIALANTRLFIRNNIALSVVFFFAANFVVGLLEIVAMLFIPLGVRISDTGASFTTEIMAGSLSNIDLLASSQPPLSEIPLGIGSGFADLAAGIVLLLLARWLMAHKTSVK
ncbi:MAG: hypothetical protein GX136_00445 [Clostridiales bacterium]|jgi:hypothetical protein|nr:hypothetical protein [Clostridiales bacterium]